MSKTATITAFVDPVLKTQAETLLHQFGLTATQAITLLYQQIVLKRQLPFESVISPISQQDSAYTKAMQEYLSYPAKPLKKPAETYPERETLYDRNLAKPIFK